MKRIMIVLELEEDKVYIVDSRELSQDILDNQQVLNLDNDELDLIGKFSL
tara:strand:- start:213 stop:362 length:150 start_codon:yes stop_codon:yes gene_type:complete